MWPVLLVLWISGSFGEIPGDFNESISNVTFSPPINLDNVLLGVVEYNEDVRMCGKS